MIPVFSAMTEVLSTKVTSRGGRGPSAAAEPVAAVGPWRLTLITSPDDCTLACDMCACGLARAQGRRPPPRRMDPALAVAVLQERRGSPLREVIPSTRGEPLLWEGLDALLAACGRLGLLVNVTTNGTFPGRGAEAWGEALLPLAS